MSDTKMTDGQILAQARAQLTDDFALTYEMLGRASMARFIGQIVQISELATLQKLKDSKAYKALDGVDINGQIVQFSTWPGFCEQLGVSYKTLNRELQVFNALGGEVMEAMTDAGITKQSMLLLTKQDEVVIEGVVEEVIQAGDDKDKIKTLIEDQTAAIKAQVSQEKQAKKELNQQLKTEQAEHAITQQSLDENRAKLDDNTKKLARYETIGVGDSNELFRSFDEQTNKLVMGLAQAYSAMADLSEALNNHEHLQGALRARCISEIITKKEMMVVEFNERNTQLNNACSYKPVDNTDEFGFDKDAVVFGSDEHIAMESGVELILDEPSASKQIRHASLTIEEVQYKHLEVAGVVSIKTSNFTDNLMIYDLVSLSTKEAGVIDARVSIDENMYRFTKLTFEEVQVIRKGMDAEITSDEASRLLLHDLTLETDTDVADANAGKKVKLELHKDAGYLELDDVLLLRNTKKETAPFKVKKVTKTSYMLESVKQ